MTALPAVLFDVGGPLDLEVEHERLVDEGILAAVRAEGLEATASDVAAASEHAVSAFAPNAYTAMLWELCGHDAGRAARAYAAVSADSERRRVARGGLELRPGIDRLITQLHRRGVRLGLAANQPARVLAELDAFGIGECFTHREVSGHHGYRKPDVRLFLRVCEGLGVAPEECVMVGDRIDNDMVPAKLLGMQTVLFRTGRHINQQPRSWEEVADAEVRSVDELKRVLLGMLRMGGRLRA